MKLLQSSLLAMVLLMHGFSCHSSENSSLFTRFFSHQKTSGIIRLLSRVTIFAPVALALPTAIYNEYQKNLLIRSNAQLLSENPAVQKDVDHCKKIFFDEVRRNELSPIKEDRYFIITKQSPGIEHNVFYLGDDLFDYKNPQSVGWFGSNIRYPLRDDALLTGIIGHEVGHIKRQHILKKTILFTLMPLGICAMHAKLLQSVKTTVGKNVVSLPLVLGLSAISCVVQRYYSRLSERQADECVKNNPAVLDALASYFEQFTESKSTIFLAPLFEHHPEHLERARRFRERAAHLQKTLVNH